MYVDWKKVDHWVQNLNREYDNLKEKASNLFATMEKQTNRLSDETSKKTLLSAIEKVRTKYNGTLANTSKAIDKLKLLYGDAVEVVKALEIAAALILL